MAKIKTGTAPVGPEPESPSDAESRALDHELRLWAELLLDICLDKRSREQQKGPESNTLDVAAREPYDQNTFPSGCNDL
jgi:hypothetical protein